jgi:hypothetical protein
MWRFLVQVALDPRPLPAYTDFNIQPIGNGLVVAQLG